MDLRHRGNVAALAIAVVVFFTGAGTAQAANKEIWAAAGFIYSVTIFSPRHDFDTPEGAFEYLKTKFEYCNDYYKECYTLENLRPVIHPQIIQWNGVSQSWSIDRRRCSYSGPCFVDSGHTGFSAGPKCPEGKPSFGTKQLNSDYYRRDIVCMALVPDIQVCDDCGGKGVPRTSRCALA